MSIALETLRMFLYEVNSQLSRHRLIYEICFIYETKTAVQLVYVTSLCGHNSEYC